MLYNHYLIFSHVLSYTPSNIIIIKIVSFVSSACIADGNETPDEIEPQNDDEDDEGNEFSEDLELNDLNDKDVMDYMDQAGPSHGGEGSSSGNTLHKLLFYTKKSPSQFSRIWKFANGTITRRICGGTGWRTTPRRTK